VPDVIVMWLDFAWMLCFSGHTNIESDCTRMPFPLQVGEILYVKGALERLLKLCKSYHSDGANAPLTPKQEQLYLAKAAMMGTSGLRGQFRFC
jgi:magnesium-transporting ATPase (P-type)